MLADQDNFINEAASTIYQLSQEEQVRLQCEAREDYYRRQRSVQHRLNRQKDTIESQNATIESQNATIKQLTNEIASLQKEIASLKKPISN